VELLEDRSVDTVGLNAGAIHALWTLHGLGAIDGNVMLKVVACLGHPSPGVRRNAVLVLPRTAEGSAALVSRGPLTDADAQVRLAALLALAEMPEGDLAGQGALAVLNQPATANDHWLTDAVIAAAATHARYFLRATVAQKAPPAGRTPEVLAIVAEHFARGGPADTVGELLAVAAFVGEARRAEALVAGLAKGWPRNTSAKLSESEEQALAQLLAKGGPANQGTVLKLASALGAKGLEKYAGKVVEAMLATVADEKQADDARSAAVRQLVALRPADAGIVDKTLEALTPRSSPTLAAGLLDALAASEAANVGPTVVKLLPTWPPSARGPALRLLLARNDSTRALIEGLEQGKLQLSDLALDQKQALASHRDQDIAARAKKLLERGGGLPSADRQKVIDQFLHVTKKTGNADKGKLIFKNTCAKCHLHGGEGAQIGPDLTGMAVHPKEHLIVEILDPSRSVEGNYRVYTVATTDGRTLTGLLASETKTSVELLDSEAKKHTLLRENIEELKASNKSLMPEGFEKQLSETDLTDLLEFLTRRGQYLPLPLAKAATVVTTRGMFYSETSEQERLVFADWGPKTFKGIPFQLIDPLGGRQPNAILLYGPQGAIPPRMPKAVKVPCNAPAKAIHFLSGVSGWGFPYGPKGSVSLIVRLHYADGTTEDHALKNGDQFADYIRRVDVPGSEFAFDLAGRQIRYLKVVPERGEVIKEIELVKGPDQTAPVVMAVTVEPK
jgi:putative heme-binding domain-containing protein